MSTPYVGNNTSGQFDPTYTPTGETSTPINVESMPLLINGKQVAGYQATYANGTSKWTAQVHTDDLWDRDSVDNSTFTGTYNETSKKWEWKQSSYPRDTSIQNLWKDARVQVVDDEGNVKQERIGKNWSEVKSQFNNAKGSNSVQKSLSSVQTQALKQEVGGLANLQKDEKFNKLPGVKGTATQFTTDTFNSANLKNLTGSIEATQTRTTYGNYYYPQDIGANKQDRIIFTMKQSSGSKINVDLNNPNVNAFQRKTTPIKGSVTLPITAGIKDLNSVDWQGSTMNAAQAFGAAAAMNIIQEKGRRAEALGDVLNEAGDFLTKNNDAAKALSLRIAQEAVGTQNLLSRATGAIANPNMELLFNAPGLRAFDFTFQMSPRDHHEAGQIRSIINFFKQGMSVKTTSSNVFLKAPNIFNIDYITFNEEGKMERHPSINIIKTCALLSCSVDYTPNNSYMTYSDSKRSMVAYTMNLQFNELDPLYEKDYYTGLGMQGNVAGGGSAEAKQSLADAPSEFIGF